MKAEARTNSKREHSLLSFGKHIRRSEHARIFDSHTYLLNDNNERSHSLFALEASRILDTDY